MEWFQSYQFRQINPDGMSHITKDEAIKSFNRINSGRSIQTGDLVTEKVPEEDMFQSYQFRQINPDLYQ